MSILGVRWVGIVINPRVVVISVCGRRCDMSGPRGVIRTRSWDYHRVSRCWSRRAQVSSRGKVAFQDDLHRLTCCRLRSLRKGLNGLDGPLEAMSGSIQTPLRDQQTNLPLLVRRQAGKRTCDGGPTLPRFCYQFLQLRFIQGQAVSGNMAP